MRASKTARSSGCHGLVSCGRMRSFWNCCLSRAVQRRPVPRPSDAKAQSFCRILGLLRLERIVALQLKHDLASSASVAAHGRFPQPEITVALATRHRTHRRTDRTHASLTQRQISSTISVICEQWKPRRATAAFP